MSSDIDLIHLWTFGACSTVIFTLPFDQKYLALYIEDVSTVIPWLTSDPANEFFG
jgi:hypothetical protein